MYCTECGAFNAETSQYCFACGSHLEVEAFTAVNDETLYKAVIGEHNQHEYVRLFERLSVGKSRLSWNTGAFFFTFCWMLYRKMWLTAIAYHVFPIFIAILLVLVADSSALSVFISVVFLLAQYFVIPLYSNFIYYQHCRKLVEKVRLQEANNPVMQLKLAAYKGGTSKLAAILYASFSMLIFLLLILAIAIPAYHGYKSRSNTQQAWEFGYAATAAIGQYYKVHSMSPRRLSDAGFMQDRPENVKDIVWLSDRNRLIVTLNNQPEGALEFQLVHRQREYDEWKCRGVNIDPKLLPQQCR